MQSKVYIIITEKINNLLEKQIISPNQLGTWSAPLFNKFA